MAERVLTDEEVRRTIAAAHAHFDMYAIARAVEAAVIAKMEKRLVNAWGKPCISIEQAEREARKRERVAWGAGLRWGQYHPEWTNTTQSAEVDRAYPLPACDKCGQELP